MQRPSGVQWALLWAGALWVVFALAVIENAWRAILGGAVIVALAYWQLATKRVTSSASLSNGDSCSFIALSDPTVLSADSPSARSSVNAGVSARQVGLGRALMFALAVVWALIAATVQSEANDVASLIGRWLGALLIPFLIAYVARGRRGDWPGFVTWFSVSIVLMTVVSGLGRTEEFGARARTKQEIKAALAGATNHTLPEIIRLIRSQDASGFDRGFIKSVEKNLYVGFGTGTALVNVRLLGVTDRDKAVRFEVRYEGTDGSQQAIEGHLLHFMHAHGTTTLEAVCSPDVTDCGRAKPLLVDAEKKVLSGLASTEIAGFLPDGECSVETVALATGRKTELALCRYQEGLALTLARAGATDTISSLRVALAGARW